MRGLRDRDTTAMKHPRRLFTKPSKNGRYTLWYNTMVDRTPRKSMARHQTLNALMAMFLPLSIDVSIYPILEIRPDEV